MWQYARVLDTDNAEAHAAVYTPTNSSVPVPTPPKVATH